MYNGEHRVGEVAILEICSPIAIVKVGRTNGLQVLLWCLALLNSALENVSGIKFAELVIFTSR